MVFLPDSFIVIISEKISNQKLHLRSGNDSFPQFLILSGMSSFFFEVEDNQSYRFTSVNQSFVKVTGIPINAIIAKDHEVIPEPSLSMVLGKYREAIETKNLVHWEETTNYPNGTLTGIVTIAPIFRCFR